MPEISISNTPQTSESPDPVTAAVGLARRIPELGVIGTFLFLFSVVVLAGGWFIRTDFLTTNREEREERREGQAQFLKSIQDIRVEAQRVNDANMSRFERIIDEMRKDAIESRRENMETRAALLQSNAHLGSALQELKALKQSIPARPPMPSKD
jgi:hypothetical protein